MKRGHRYTVKELQAAPPQELNLNFPSLRGQPFASFLPSSKCPLVGPVLVRRGRNGGFIQLMRHGLHELDEGAAATMTGRK